VAPLSNTGCNTAERDINERQSQKHDFDLISLLFPPIQQSQIGSTAQGIFKCEMLSFLRQSREFTQYQPPRLACGQVRAKGRKAGGNQIGIDEVNYSAFARKILSRKRGLPRSIGPRNYDAAWSYRVSLPHLNITIL
jgi:hypothetical protein